MRVGGDPDGSPPMHSSCYGAETPAALRADRALAAALGDGAFGVAHCPRDRPSTVFPKPGPRSVYGAGLLL
jgi:hypothetical protein